MTWPGTWRSGAGTGTAYPAACQTDSRGAVTGSSRVYRDGGWHSRAAACRVANRCVSAPAYAGPENGFRLARTAVP